MLLGLPRSVWSTNFFFSVLEGGKGCVFAVHSTPSNYSRFYVISRLSSDEM